ncbi:MAG: glycogen/starch/alpha-glucan phosphorylase [Deltaproteobacteria bacterium]|nr:glycogen/starch/alpha-glucan phosphorylase [Deltaproteobacteria bacterium]
MKSQKKDPIASETIDKKTSESNGLSNGLSDVDQLIAAFKRRMMLTVAHDLGTSSDHDKYNALAYAIREEMIRKWIQTQAHYYKVNPRRIYYLSLEFLMGRTLGNALINLGLTETVSQAMEQLGFDFERIQNREWDAGLGNGGLGRLAACFLDSMATLELPAYGYGIRYEYGMFKQKIEHQQQTEYPDNWLRLGNPWEIKRTVDHYPIHFMGRVDTYRDKDGELQSKWIDTQTMVAIASDVPIPGYQTNTVNTLKLWTAASTREFNLANFNSGDYIGAILEKHQSEVISKVLYPNDNNYEGKELRLKQQYFMVSASLQDILNRLKKCKDKVEDLPLKAAIQLNDTHPSIAIAELMRILMDDHHFTWDKSWDITTRTFAYTNHTVLPEALEKWPLSLMERVLPRHMQIIFEINQRFLNFVSANFPGDFELRERLSIIQEGEPKNVRMSHLAIIGSFSVNGVAELHSKLLREGIFKDFYQIFPNKFNNKTNGITPRRWLKNANPLLSGLITKKIGDAWIKDLEHLKELEAYHDDEAFREEWMAIKRENKKSLIHLINRSNKMNWDINLDSIFDVQVKRMHEYKRQLLNLFHALKIYNQIRSGDVQDIVPRTIIFSGKAAPGYVMAKEVIHLINAVGDIVNNDKKVGDLLKIIFIPNYGVTLAETIIPGSDLSEQISTAGMEASGTGNMKFALNGALTIGTLDGANIEIMEEVGQDNIFIFGHTEEELRELKQSGYNPRDYYENDAELKLLLDQINEGYFSPNDRDAFKPIFNRLVNEGDHYCLLGDFHKYIESQKQVSETYLNQEKWARMSILNVARIGKFSSDRVIRQYSEEIWKVDPCAWQEPIEG